MNYCIKCHSCMEVDIQLYIFPSELTRRSFDIELEMIDYQVNINKQSHFLSSVEQVIFLKVNLLCVIVNSRRNNSLCQF